MGWTAPASHRPLDFRHRDAAELQVSGNMTPTLTVSAAWARPVAMAGAVNSRVRRRITGPPEWQSILTYREAMTAGNEERCSNSDVLGYLRPRLRRNSIAPAVANSGSRRLD
jgi:hypothetical protein